MSANYEHAEVAIRCRVRIGSIATTNTNYGENREMTCMMLHGNLRTDPNGILQEEENGSNACNDETAQYDTVQRRANAYCLEPNIITQTNKNSTGPKLMFKPVPRPPSRPKTRILSLNDDVVKHHSPIDPASALPVYNGIPTKLHKNPQSPDSQEVQGTHRLRRVNTPFPSSVRAAAMFAVKKKAVAVTVDQEEEEAYAISLDHIVVVHLNPSPGYDALSNTQLICVTTIDGVILQISFHNQREQDLLFGFLQAFLLPSIIMIQVDTLRYTNSNLYRVDSGATFDLDMDKLETREIHCRSLNESYWEKIKRRTHNLLSCTENICPGDDSDNIYICEGCSEKGNNTVLTEMEIDDGCSLNRELSDISETIHSEREYSVHGIDTTNSPMVVSRTPNGKDVCGTRTIVEPALADDRDDAI